MVGRDHARLRAVAGDIRDRQGGVWRYFRCRTDRVAVGGPFDLVSHEHRSDQGRARTDEGPKLCKIQARPHQEIHQSGRSVSRGRRTSQGHHVGGLWGRRQTDADDRLQVLRDLAGRCCSRSCPALRFGMGCRCLRLRCRAWIAVDIDPEMQITLTVSAQGECRK